MRTLTKYAKIHRKNPTQAEKELKRKLLNCGVKLRTEKPFGPYIVDVLLPLKRVVIEVDGPYHVNTKKYDEKRDNFLCNLGMKIIHITNDEVLNTDCKHLFNEIAAIPDVMWTKNSWRQVFGTANF